MRFMEWADDGGKNSGVRGFFFIELKNLFSVVLLRFNPGSREAFHSHAFNAVTLWLKGRVYEEKPRFGSGTPRQTGIFGSGFKRWKYTRRDNMHRVSSVGRSWALSVRGPWVDTWQELRWDYGRGELRIFTLKSPGRQVVGNEPV